MNKNAFVFYETFEEQLNELSEEMQLKFFKIIIAYGLHGIEPENLSGIEKAFWIGIQKDIDNAQERRNTNVENGRKGGRPKPTETENLSRLTENNRPKKSVNQQKPNETEKKVGLTDENLNVYVNEDVYVNDDVNTQGGSSEPQGVRAEKTISSSPKKFEKPTVNEVQAYCNERKNSLSAQEFWDFYESKGWKIGSSPMKDWRACVRTWEQRRKNEDSGGRVKKSGTMWGNESKIPEEYYAIFDQPVGSRK